MNKAVRQLGVIIKDSPAEIRVKALHAFAALMTLEVIELTVAYVIVFISIIHVLVNRTTELCFISEGESVVG